MIRVNFGDVEINADGESFIFRPTFANCIKLGTPKQIVNVFSDLFAIGALERVENSLAHFAVDSINAEQKRVLRAAILVMTACAEKDSNPLIGEFEPASNGLSFVKRKIPTDNIITIARHLMKHMIIGKPSDKKKSSDDYADEFDPSIVVDMAILHLGLDEKTALGLSMSRFQSMFDMKFPEQKSDEPSDKEHDDCMDWLAEVNAKRSQK